MKRNRKITKVFAILLCVCMSFGLTACANQEDIDSSVTPLSEQITTINATLTEMQTLDTTLDGYIDTLETKVATLETDLTAVNTTVETLEENSATKTALLETKTALESEINTIKADITVLKAKDTELDGKITELQTALSAEIADTETWIEDTFATKTAFDTLKTEINTSLATLQGKIDGLETSVDMLNTTVTALQTQVEENTKKLEEFEIRINCLEGKHVINETETISYVYTWSETAPTSTKNYTCLHCGKAIEENVSPSVWSVGDKVTYVAKDGNSYVSTVGEVTDGKAVLVSDEQWSTGKRTISKEELLAIVETKGARVPTLTEAVWTNIFEPWAYTTLPISDGGYADKTISVAYSSDVLSFVVNKETSLGIYNSTINNYFSNENTWIGRYVWDVEFTTAE